MKQLFAVILAVLVVLVTGCGMRQNKQTTEKKGGFTGAQGEVKLITLDPGHFHAALVQKKMYPQVDPVVYVYAPEGQDVKDHLAKIDAYNTRADNPTRWEEKTFTGADYLEKMITEKPGNVVVLAGNNAKKTEYILKSVEAGLNVLADKPMVISPEKFPMLEQAFSEAAQKNVLLYDIMTERYEITTILLKEISKIPEVFGKLQTGTADDPAIAKESVHNFCKVVSGVPLKRPAWFFDTDQQGEGIADVSTHLVDLVQWEAFPEVSLKKEDVEMLSAKRWTTDLTADNFKKVTGLDQYPEFLKKSVENNTLKVFSNGEINYKLRGIYVKVIIKWDFEAPEGAGDSYSCAMKGSLCNLMIKQGPEQKYQPTLYIEANRKEGLDTFESGLSKAVNQDLAAKYPGIKLVKVNDNLWTVDIPDQYKEGHEAHFGQVTEKYLQCLVEGKLPEWEVPDMIVKYYITTEAMKMAKEIK